VAELKVLKGPFPVIRMRLDFGAFAEELAGNWVGVWINPSVELMARLAAHQVRAEPAEARALQEAAQGDGRELSAEEQARYDELVAEAASAYPAAERVAELNAIYAELWGCSAEDVGGLLGGPPLLVGWLVDQTWAMINGRREAATKN
jgi:hypothetical protein